MKDKIQALANRHNDLERSLALQAWIPDIFDGPHKPKTQLVSKPMGFKGLQVYKMIVTKADGTTMNVPIEEVPENLR